MKNLINTVTHWLYQLPIRIKLLFFSGLIYILSVLVFSYFVDLYSKIEADNLPRIELKQTVDVIFRNLKKETTLKKINETAQLSFIDKLVVENHKGEVVRQWDKKGVSSGELHFYKLSIEDHSLIKSILIGVSHDKYHYDVSAVSDFKYVSIYLSALIVLLVILLVNILVISPIDTMIKTVNKYIEKENELDYGADSKTKSKIFELSETISALKTNLAKGKEKEKQLINIQTRLSSVLNTIGDAIITVNDKSNIVMVNPAFEKTWGYDKESVLGRDLDAMMPEYYREAHKIGFKRYLESGVKKVLNQNLELEALHADGSIFPIEIHISETKINDELFFTAAIRDISHRKRIEQELREAKENVEEMLEQRTRALVIRLSELNCLYGLSKLLQDNGHNISHILKELPDLIINACKHPHNACCLISYDGHEYKTKNYKETAKKIYENITINEVNKGFIRLYYLDTMTPDVENQFQGYEERLLENICIRLSRHMEHLITNQDLEYANQALKDTQLQLIQAEKLDTIGTLAAGVAHEVKNPLAVIQLGVDYLKRKSSNNDAILDVISEIEEAIMRADSVIKELVNFSASNDLTLESLDVNQLIDDSLLLVKHELLKNSILIKKNYSDDLPCISGDKQKLGQVFINLVINAIHAMEKTNEKIININTYTSTVEDADFSISGKYNVSDSLVFISFQDSGTGIDEDKLDKIFEPFFTTKPSGKGSGLGLTVSQNIIRLHGGELKFENANNGGTIAKLTFKS